MKLKLFLICFVTVLIFLALRVQATPFIVGFVNDSYDGEFADGHTVLLWNSANISNNRTDVIGPTGFSGTSNFFMIDCALFKQSCKVGDILSLRVLDDGDGYVTNIVNVTITGSGFEQAEVLRLNSKPNVSILFPIDNANISGSIEFNCSAFDYDGNLANIILWTNFTGDWEINETKNVTGTSNSTIFYKDPRDGRYLWGCSVYDSLQIYNVSENRTVNYDNVKPIVESIISNETYVCGINSVVRVNCTTYDEFSGIATVIIRANSNVSGVNYSTFYAGSDVYYADVMLDQYGIWNFTCIANDSASNYDTLFSSFIMLLQDVAEIAINYVDIIFSKNQPIEDELISINVTVYNEGCVDASDVLVSYYEGDPDIDGINFANASVDILKGQEVNVSVSWQSKIGRTNIFVMGDSNNSYAENNETNNDANRSIDVVSWHLFYGNVTADKLLANSELSNLSYWLNDSNSSGNVYVSDTESQINWVKLLAIGRNLSGSPTSDDFFEIDDFLGSSTYADSVSNIYTGDGFTPKNLSNFIVSNKIIENVPIINTTQSYNFITGILWDSNDDTDGEYGVADKEDLVFITKISRKTAGNYGVYDYELITPSRLREYNPADSSEVFIYFDLN